MVVMGLRAVLFDLGGTLIRTAHPADIIRRILGKHGIERSVEEIALAHKFAEENTPLEDYGLPYYEFWIKWNRRIFDRLGVKDENDFLARVLVDEWWDNAGIEVYPDAEGALIRLRGSEFKVGIITNAFKKDIEEILKRVEMPIKFNVFVGIDSVKKPKPSPEIFLHAIRMLGIRPNEAVYIGDDPEKDYIGATNAGLRAILVDRSLAYMDRKNMIKVRNLNEALDLILESL
ncbi:MAG: HAD family hydrolase [Candidatus Bathyarchaeia archaeon]